MPCNVGRKSSEEKEQRRKEREEKRNLRKRKRREKHRKNLRKQKHKKIRKRLKKEEEKAKRTAESKGVSRRKWKTVNTEDTEIPLERSIDTNICCMCFINYEDGVLDGYGTE